MGRVLQQALVLPLKRVLVIANPASRRGAQAVQHVAASLTRRGISFDVALTNAPGHAAALARERDPGVDGIFVVGGDGTAGDVLSAVTDRPLPVGIVPCGTGNLLAGALGIPTDIPRACESLCEGRIRRIDLARLDDGRHFAVAAGVGIDAGMLVHTTPSLKRATGVAAYVLGGTAATLEGLRRGPFHVAVSVDGQTHELEALCVMVANVASILHGRITLAPRSLMDDGVLDVCVYAPRRVDQALRVAWRGLSGRFPEDSLTYFMRGGHVRVAAEPGPRLQADGELLGLSYIDAQVVPGAALVIVPDR